LLALTGAPDLISHWRFRVAAIHAAERCLDFFIVIGPRDAADVDAVEFADRRHHVEKNARPNDFVAGDRFPLMVMPKSSQMAVTVLRQMPFNVLALESAYKPRPCAR
jgi:hypothetical protein